MWVDQGYQTDLIAYDKFDDEKALNFRLAFCRKLDSIDLLVLPTNDKYLPKVTKWLSWTKTKKKHITDCCSQR